MLGIAILFSTAVFWEAREETNLYSPFPPGDWSS